MILYEVNTRVEASIAATFLDWLETHVAEMLEMDGFARGAIYEGEAPEGFRAFVSHYHVRDRRALERYFAEDAPRMRADGTGRFGEKMSATRRVLPLHRSFGG